MVNGPRHRGDTPDFLPIDSKRLRPRRPRPALPDGLLSSLRRAVIGAAKLTGIVVAIVAVMATVKWVADGTGSGEADTSQTNDEPTASTSADEPTPPATTEAGEDPVDSADTGSSSESAEESDGATFDLTITPSSGLSDGQRIEFSANLSPDDVIGLTAEICAAGNYTACTQISPLSMVLPSDDVTASLIIPRRFNTVAGGVHDCVVNSPCELRVWLTPLQVEPASALLDFDPSAPVRPTEQVTLVPDGLHGTRAEVTVVSDDVTEYNLMQCVIGDNSSCEPLTRQTQTTTSSDRLNRTATIHRTILTPSGSHDCVLDGPCELRVVTWTDVLVEPIPLEFDPSSEPVANPEALVRPSTGLDDAQLVEVRLSQSTDFEPVAVFCEIGTPACIRLGGIVAADGTGSDYFRLPRQFSVPVIDGAVDVDCSNGACEIRVQDERGTTRLPVEFKPGGDARPAPEIVLEASGTLTRGSSARIHGRNFLVVDPLSTPRVELALCFVDAAERSSGPCGLLRATPFVIERDGSFVADVTIPTGTLFAPFVGSETVCTPGCRIFATTEYDGHGTSAIAIDIEVQPTPG